MEATIKNHTVKYDYDAKGGTGNPSLLEEIRNLPSIVPNDGFEVIFFGKEEDETLCKRATLLCHRMDIDFSTGKGELHFYETEGFTALTFLKKYSIFAKFMVKLYDRQGKGMELGTIVNANLVIGRVSCSGVYEGKALSYQVFVNP